jgi:hypothetical protein
MVPPVAAGWYHRRVASPPRAAAASQELTLAAIAVVLAVFIGGAVAGLALMGIMGAFLGAFGGAMVSALVLGLRRFREANGSLEGPPPPNLDGLDSRQALTVMTAMMGAATGDAFRSELLSGLEEARRMSDPERTLEAMEALRQDHPHSPAVYAELARFHLAHDDEARGIDRATEAIRHALDGGMNTMAARLFEEFRPHRDRLALAPRHYAQLARVLRTRDATEAADWCASRSE